ncbi:MAG: hypothetical protein ACFFB7_07925 [Candidatus Sifarchaeia archaeon]
MDRYEDAYRVVSENSLSFYNDFLKTLIKDYSKMYRTPSRLNRIVTNTTNYFERTEIPFVAIDGTCSNDAFSDFMVFFAAAYGVQGSVQIESEPPKLKYNRWSMDQDVSLVAYVPVPYAEAGDVTDYEDSERFLVDDDSKVNLSSIHTRLMQLAEVFLAYNMARGSTVSCPRLILMDLSLSSALLSTDVGLERIGLFGHPLGSRTVGFRDGMVVYSHPFSIELGLPTTKKYRRWAYLVRELARAEKSDGIPLKELVAESGVSAEMWERTLHEPYSKQLFDSRGNTITPKFDFNSSWFDSVRLFEDICHRLFELRDPEALIYPIVEDGHKRLRWMSPDDVSYLVAIGIRALVEKCWEKRILLLSICKDSSTKYFSGNYLGVMRETGVFPSIPARRLPWTDRMLLECIAHKVADLGSPWTVTEFDSSYMTIRVVEEAGVKRISGVRGNVVSPERLFSRSLVQFFNSRLKPTPLMGHVVFLDRLLDPRLDSSHLDGPTIDTPELGCIHPAFFGVNTNENHGQDISIWLLSLLTRNLFPEVIGYPDPLHKADWGAKSVKKRVDALIKSSVIPFRAKPLSRLFRTTRDAGGR